MDTAPAATQSGTAAAPTRPDRAFFIDGKPILEFVTEAAFAASAEAKAAAGGDLRGANVNTVA
jgi:hypothetical protein